MLLLCYSRFSGCDSNVHKELKASFYADLNDSVTEYRMAFLYRQIDKENVLSIDRYRSQSFMPIYVVIKDVSHTRSHSERFLSNSARRPFAMRSSAFRIFHPLSGEVGSPINADYAFARKSIGDLLPHYDRILRSIRLKEIVD